MVSILKTDKIQASHGSTIEIPSGHVLQAPGHVIQVQYTQYTDTFTQSLSAETDTVLGAAALSVNITPSSTSSIIKLDAHIFHEWGSQGDAANAVWFFYRDTTALKAPAAGSRPCGISMATTSYGSDEAGSTPEIVYYSYFDAPNTTSQITYKIGILPRNNRTLSVNRTITDTDAIGFERGISFTSAMEIAQ